jgi:hypothetical protein
MNRSQHAVVALAEDFGNLQARGDNYACPE